MVAFSYLRDCITVETFDGNVHVVPMGVQSRHVDGLGRHRHKYCYLTIFDLKNKHSISDIVKSPLCLTLTCCLISFSSLSEYLASNVTKSTGPLATCYLMAWYSMYSGSPAHSCKNLYRRNVNQADSIFSATLSVRRSNSFG